MTGPTGEQSAGTARPSDEGSEPHTQLASTKPTPADLSDPFAEHAVAQSARPVAQAATRRGGWWRAVVAVVAVLLAGFGAAASSLALWANHLVNGTDAYVHTVASLAEDPGVQTAVATAASDYIIDAVDIEGLAAQAVQTTADQLGASQRTGAVMDALANSLAQSAEGRIGTVAADFVTGRQFAVLWESANRLAHEQVVMRITGQPVGRTLVLD